MYRTDMVFGDEQVKPKQRGWICCGCTRYKQDEEQNGGSDEEGSCLCGHEACTSTSPAPEPTPEPAPEPAKTPLDEHMPSPLPSSPSYNMYIWHATLGATDAAPGSASDVADHVPCYRVIVTERNDSQCSGWVCWFCKRYVASEGDADRMGVDGGEGGLKCGDCGDVEEREVVFVKGGEGEECRDSMLDDVAAGSMDCGRRVQCCS